MKKLANELFENEENKNILNKLLSQLEQILSFALFVLLKPPRLNDNFNVSRFTLIYKLVNHCVTQAILSKGYKVFYDGKENLIYDKHSIMALQRTVLENYLTFHCIFYFPESEEAKRFRYFIYNYIERKAQYERNKNIIEDPAMIRLNKQTGVDNLINPDLILSVLREERDNMVTKMKESPLYELLSTKQKSKIYNRVPDWKIDGSWYDLANNAKFNEANFSYTYNILSSSVHSGVTSSMLFNIDNMLDKEYLTIILSTLIASSIIICRGLLEYYDIADDKERIKKNNEMFELIKNRSILGIQINLFKQDNKLIRYFNEY